jgi:uncharacterized membrane protein
VELLIYYYIDYRFFICSPLVQIKKYKSKFFLSLFSDIHGLGFSNYFKAILGGHASKLLPLAEFAVGMKQHKYCSFI